MTHRILIVEDNLLNLELLTDWLEMEGFEVLTAQNLAQAYTQMENRDPHAVLLDVQLGAEDGLDVAAWTRKHSRLHSTPIIAVTAHAMVTDQERVIQAGCNACVSKPIDFKALRQQIDWWLTRSEPAGR